MATAPIRWMVALDGGTSHTRARLVHDDRVVATARRAVGARETVLADGRRTLAPAVRDAIREVLQAAGGVRPDLIAAAGMLTADVGLAEVPHVVAPAGPEELARGALLLDLPEVAERPILFIPGVRTPPASGPGGWASADLMRGEECETLGAWSLVPARAADGPPPSSAFLWPGSHSKLVQVDGRGRIVRSQTTLAGELTEAVARHTLLAASLPAELPDVPDREALATGARWALEEGLGRAAFLVRLAASTETLGPLERASFWVGAVIADDVAHLARHPILEGPVPVWVGGRQPQRSLYASELRGRRRRVNELDDDTAESASALGVLAVARQFRRLGGG